MIIRYLFLYAEDHPDFADEIVIFTLFRNNSVFSVYAQS